MMSVSAACRAMALEGLVIGSQGNASQRYLNQMLIKASGVTCRDMRQGKARMQASLALDSGESFTHGVKPSTDSDAHRYIYNLIPGINGIVHTHSPYATAWAVAGKAIPCCYTAQSDWFGGDIPCGAYCPIGTEDIGIEVVRLYEVDHRRRAFLIRQHGLFAIGASLEEAVEAALQAEHFARVAYLAEKLGGLKLIPKEEIAANYERYHSNYGQSADDTERDRQTTRVSDR